MYRRAEAVQNPVNQLVKKCVQLPTATVRTCGNPSVVVENHWFSIFNTASYTRYYPHTCMHHDHWKRPSFTRFPHRLLLPTRMNKGE